MSDYKIHECWKVGSNKLYLESKKGRYNFSYCGREEFEDRLFFIRINQSERFAFKHDHQIALLTAVLENDALPHRFVENCEKFLSSIHEIKGKRKRAERLKYNVDLVSYVDKKLWGCGLNEDR